jgi:hypothetical protein
MLYQYGGSIMHDANNNTVYNGESSLLLNDNLEMSYIKIKINIFYRLKWNYNDINIKII